MKPLNLDLHQRLLALSPRQRTVLADRLKQLKKDSLEQTTSSQLVAYVVPGENGEVDLAALKAAVGAKLPSYMVPTAVVLLDKLPLNANGKVDAKALPMPRRATNCLDNAVATTTPIEATLVDIWCKVLGLNAIGIHDNFFELGGDSILSIQIVSRAREAGLRLAPNQLFDFPTVAELAIAVNATPTVVATQSMVTGAVPLTPIQRWFFEQEMSALEHWHQAMLFELPVGVRVEQVERAIATLYKHHDALRMRFTPDVRSPAGWQQFNADTQRSPELMEVDISEFGFDQQQRTVDQYGSELHSKTSLRDGPLLNAVLFKRKESEPGWLLMSLHHLVVDVVSWQILQDDIQRLLSPWPEQLPAKTTAFKEWAELLVARASRRKSELPFWLSQLGMPVAELPQASDSDLPATEGCAGTVTVALSCEETAALLQQVPAVYGTQINDVLLSALCRTLLSWASERTDIHRKNNEQAEVDSRLRIELESHGREEFASGVDLSRTVGWFTTTYPVCLQLPDRTDSSKDLGETIKSVKEQLRSVPARGLGYGLLRYLADEATCQQLAGFAPAEVLFNYLGQQSGGKALLREDRAVSETADGRALNGVRALQNFSVGTLRDSHNERGYLLEINAWVAGGQLHFNWIYDTEHYQTETVFTLARACLGNLAELIAHCLSVQRGGFTPSDFPDVAFDQSSLDDFIVQLPDSVQANIEALYPLAPLQEAFLWNSLQTSAESGLLHMRGTLRGDLDLVLLKQAWYEVADRHAVLRSSVHWEGIAQPVQLVQKRVNLPWQVLDWRDEEAAAIDERMTAFLECDRTQSFDLTQAPITRLALVRTGDLTHELIWTCHHLMLDGWSGTLVVNQVLSRYELLRSATPPVEDAIAASYQDYIHWRNQQDHTAAQQFWTTYLKAFTPSPHPPSPIPPSLYSSSRQLSTTNIQPFLRTHRLTFNTLIQATWALTPSHSQQSARYCLRRNGLRSPGRFARGGLYCWTVDQCSSCASNRQARRFRCVLAANPSAAAGGG